MKKLAAIILIILVLHCPGRAALPVSDLSALAQRIGLMAQEIAKWTLYINKFKDYTRILGNLKKNFEHTVLGLTQAEINQLIGDNIELTGKIIDSIAYDDKDKLDEWTEIFKDHRQLEVKYQNIKDTEYLLENPLAQNPSIRGIFEESIRQREEALQNLQKQIVDLQQIRESEKEVLDKLKHYAEQVELLAGDEYPSYAKVSTLINLMDLDLLKLATTQLALYRMMLETELKSMTGELHATQQQLRQAHEEVKNYQLVKE